MRKLVISCLLLVVSLPIAFISTILLHPFWRWFEKLSGIESFGHSGPAEWCYWFDYIVLLVIAAFIVSNTGKRNE